MDVVMVYMKEHKEATYQELDQKCGLYGHASQLLNYLAYDGRIKERVCETGRCKIYKYIHD